MTKTMLRLCFDDAAAIDRDVNGNVIVGGFAAVNDGRAMTVVAYSPTGTLMFSRINPVGPSNTETIVDLCAGKNGTYSVIGQGFNRPQNDNTFTGLYQHTVGVGDVDGNVDDLLQVINSRGRCSPNPQSRCRGDVAPWPAGDDLVNVDDLLLLITNWGG
jgi:hypothetical protein